MRFTVTRLLGPASPSGLKGTHTHTRAMETDLPGYHKYRRELLGMSSCRVGMLEPLFIDTEFKGMS